MRSKVIGLICLFLCGCAAQDVPPGKLKLAYCPTPVKVSIPDMFVGGSDIRDVFDTKSVWKDIGQVSLAVSSPQKPSFMLLIAENAPIASRQGKVAFDEFQRMKDAMHQPGADAALAQTNDFFSSKGVSLNKLKVLASDSGDTWAATVFSMEGAGQGLNFQSVIAGKITYVSQCVIDALVFAPASGASADELMGIVKSVKIE